MASAYFAVWTVLGLAAYPIGVALTTMEMQQPALSRIVPIAIGAVVLICRCVSAHGLESASTGMLPRSLARTIPGPGGAWRQGLRMGLQCSRCCANLMVILLVLGVMDLKADGDHHRRDHASNASRPRVSASLAAIGVVGSRGRGWC